MNPNTLSAAQIAFLQAHKRRKIRIHLYRISILILFLFLWEFSTYKGWIDDFIFSSPSKLVLCCYHMILETNYSTILELHCLKPLSASCW